MPGRAPRRNLMPTSALDAQLAPHDCTIEESAIEECHHGIFLEATLKLPRSCPRAPVELSWLVIDAHGFSSYVLCYAAGSTASVLRGWPCSATVHVCAGNQSGGYGASDKWFPRC